VLCTKNTKQEKVLKTVLGHVQQHSNRMRWTANPRQSNRNTDKIDYKHLREGRTPRQTTPKQPAHRTIESDMEDEEEMQQNKNDESEQMIETLEKNLKHERELHQNTTQEAQQITQELSQINQKYINLTEEAQEIKRHNNSLNQLNTEQRTIIDELEKENEQLKEQLRDTDTTNKLLRGLLEKEKQRNATNHKKIDTLLIADSNRRTILKPLKTALPNHNIQSREDIFTTDQLLDQTQNNHIKQPELTIIMIGTNDARKGKLTKASKNLEQLSKKLSENTIYVNIPPIEIGAPGDDEYEDAAATRTLINNMINNKFPQTVRMNTMANIQRTEKNILEERDGYHLAAKPNPQTKRTAKRQ
jgi:FtsZ-binding cell division protein ZapB